VATPKRSPKKKPVYKKKTKPANIYWRFIGIILVLIVLSPFYYGYVLKLFSSTWQWLRDDTGKYPQYRAYKSFDIHIPTQYKFHGIDVSYAQGRIDWTKVKAMKEDSVHVSFAFIKATEGLLKVDPYFKRNWREAPKNGIICGAYHFMRANKNGQWQARFFLQNVSMEKGDGVSPEEMRKQLQAFLTAVEKKTSTKPIIYTTLSFYADYLAGFFNDYPLWIAHYDEPDLVEGQHLNWQFWQHSDKARVSGIYHTVDFNVFKGDSTAFQQMLVK
jgi:lysozyme